MAPRLQRAVTCALWLAVLALSPAARATGDHMTSQHGARGGGNRTQLSRIFQFNKENTAIRVELDFAIPFLSIPVNTKSKTGATGKDYLVDVNLGALAAGGIFTVMSLIFIPKLFKGFKPLVTYDSEEKSERGLPGMLSRLEEALLEHNIDSASCSQRAVCWLVHSAVGKVNGGSGGSLDKIVDGVTSNHWLTQMVQGTAIQEAIDNGRKGKNCSVLYSRCHLTQETMTRYFTGGIK